MTDKTERFRQAFGELTDMDFPPGSTIVAVSELHTELVDYDGYIAGLLFSDTPKPKLPRPDAELLRRMESTLAQYPESSELHLYVGRMKKIAEVLELAQSADCYPGH
jgi:hypothetical protein